METKTTNPIREFIIWIFIAIPFVYAFFIYDQLPNEVPLHWNAQGEADRYGSKLVGALMLPLINLGVYILLLLLPRLDPRKRNYQFFQGPYFYLRIGLAGFFSAIYIASMLQTQGYQIIDGKVIISLVMLLLIFLGNFLKNIRSNYFVGIRTPWTLENPEVWKRTHALGGKLMFYSGILGLIAILFAPNAQWYMPIVMSVIVISVLVPVVYSYFVYKQLRNGVNK